ncbi:MAG: FAD-binding protein [Calditrichaeota bacterium]|nr:MAG: FAD-binding protein [Calditrichota bacterium]
MIKEIELNCTPSEAADSQSIERLVASNCQIEVQEINSIEYLRRSIDARSKQPKIILRLKVYINEEPPERERAIDQLSRVGSKRQVLIVGAGPAGYFAAMELIKAGIKPVIFERGKDVQARRRDLRAIQQEGVVNPDSNYCFGEGGAGTYSDGKLYTGSKKRGPVKQILQLLVDHGANPDILFDAHPHIGSNKLPQVIQAIRETIQKMGGEIHFQARVSDFIVHEGVMRGVVVNDEKEFLSEAVILATGHSARDIFDLMGKNKIRLEAKPFAMGIRIEHPQALIDTMQYHQKPRDANLPAASYKMVTQVKNRGVFSFCMCPGGLIVPTATAPGELVVNGMSMAKRDSKFANSGMVVAIEPDDLQELKRFAELRCLQFQRAVETAVFNFGDGSQAAPAQRMTDFVKGTLSDKLPSSSYIPGIYSAPLHEILPGRITESLQIAFKQFGKKYRGFLTEEANVVGLESRTSSPIRIPRDREKCTHTEVDKLYPCGEGAGYAGGIISAALDGQLVARAVAAREF